MASSYLRLISDPSIENDSPEYIPKVSNAEERKVAKLLIEKGFRLEPDPQGNIAMGYGCVSVQRRSNWSAVHVDIPVIYGRQNIIWEQIYTVATWHTAVCKY